MEESVKTTSKKWDTPVPRIKKIGTVILDKDINVDDVILRGKLKLSVQESPSKSPNKTKYYEIFALDKSDK